MYFARVKRSGQGTGLAGQGPGATRFCRPKPGPSVLAVPNRYQEAPP